MTNQFEIYIISTPPNPNLNPNPNLTITIAVARQNPILYMLYASSDRW